MNFNAIFSLYPNVASIETLDGVTTVKDTNGNTVTVDKSLVDTWVNPDLYKYLRAKEYPPITDYLDGVVKGDQAQIDAYIAACQAVKAKYPKV